MNYTQTYDPMQASAMRQQQNTRLSQSIGEGIDDVRTSLKENAAWKKFNAKNKSEAEAKARYWDSVTSYAQESGIDLSKHPEAQAMQTAIANNEVPSDKFAEKAAELFQKVQATAETQKTIGEQSPQVQDLMSQVQIKGIPEDQTSPAQPKTSINSGPLAQFQTDTPFGLNSDVVGQEYDRLLGATSPIPEAPERKETVEELQRRDVLDQQRTMVGVMRERAKRGLLNPKDAEKFSSDMMSLASKDKDIEIKKLELEIANAKAKKTAETGVITDALKANQKIIDASGKQVTSMSASEAVDNAGAYGVVPGSKEYAPERNYFSGSGVGRNSDEQKLMDTVRKNLEARNKNNFRTEPILDDFGEPTGRVQKVPIPDPTAERIFSNRDEWEKYVWDNHPAYATAFGYKRPGQAPRARGSGF